MLTYRSHIDFLTMMAVAKAASLCRVLAYCALPPYDTVTTIDDARRVADELRGAVGELRAAVPNEVKDAFDGNLARHLRFIKRNLDDNYPMDALGMLWTSPKGTCRQFYGPSTRGAKSNHPKMLK